MELWVPHLNSQHVGVIMSNNPALETLRVKNLSPQSKDLGSQKVENLPPPTRLQVGNVHGHDVRRVIWQMKSIICNPFALDFFHSEFKLLPEVTVCFFPMYHSAV